MVSGACQRRSALLLASRFVGNVGHALVSAGALVLLTLDADTIVALRQDDVRDTETGAERGRNHHIVVAAWRKVIDGSRTRLAGTPHPPARRGCAANLVPR